LVLPLLLFLLLLLLQANPYAPQPLLRLFEDPSQKKKKTMMMMIR
jgi:hypothetical protein